MKINTLNTPQGNNKSVNIEKTYMILQTPIHERVFGYNANIKATKTNNTKVTFDKMVGALKQDILEGSNYDFIRKTVINGLNNNEDVKSIKKTIKSAKEKLGSFTFGGFQEVGRTNEGMEYNGCIQIDLDFKFKGGDVLAQEVKEKLSKLPYVAFAAISPSGVGVKGIIATNNGDKKLHDSVNLQLKNILVNYLNIEGKYIDLLPISQACFAPVDPTIYVNRDADVYEVDFENLEVVEEVVEVLGYNSAVNNDRTIAKVLDVATRKAYKDNDDFSTPWLQTYIGVTISYGVEMEVAFNHLYTLGLEDRISKKTKRQFPDMYKRYAKNFGTRQMADYEDDVVVEYKDVYQLEGRKLSDVGITLPKKAIIVSPTGSGKTTFFAKMEAKKILIVPTVSQVLQVAQDHNASPYYENAKELSDFIVTTTQSFIGLSDNINLDDYMIIKDEFHNATVSSTASFMLKEERALADILMNHSNYYCITATYVPNLHPAYDLPIINVEGDKEVKRIFNYGTYNNKYATAAKFFEVAKKDGYFPVILFNNTKYGLDRMVATINTKGFNPTLINSKRKAYEEYTKITIDGVVGSDVDGLITTTVIKEGINIIKHPKKIRIAVFGSFSSLEVEQYAARFRNAEVVELTMFRSDKSEIKVSNFNYDFEFTKHKQNAMVLKSKIEELSKIYKTMKDGDKLLKNAIKNIRDINGHYVYMEGDEVFIDYVSISNMIYEADKAAQYSDPRYFIFKSVKMGWELDTNVNHLNEDITQEDKDSINKTIEQTKEQRAREIDNVLEGIIEGKECLSDESIKEEVNQDIKDVKFKVSYLLNVHTNNPKEAVELLREIGLSTSNWSKFKRVESIEYFRKENVKNEFIDKMYSSFNIGDIYTVGQINEIVNNINKEVYNTSKLSSTKTTRIFKDFFVTRRGKITIDGKKVSGYRIDDDRVFKMFNKVDSSDLAEIMSFLIK